jgi:cell division protein FtsZ
MDNLVNQAMKYSDNARNQTGSEDTESSEFGEPRIVIFGCGGAGNNTVNRLHDVGVDGATTIALNTDRQHLEMIEADQKILVGKDSTQGLGAGGDPQTGERVTKRAQGTVREALGDADLVFITAGMGGGTGTGASPVVAEVAKDVGAIVVGMVSLPFDVEQARLEKAEKGIETLSNEADSIIVLDNERLLEYVPNLPVGKAFSVMDQIISQTVKGISETITQPSLINLDYADMSAVMNDGGVAAMLVGESQDENKRQVVKDALSHPLLDVDYRGASGGLVHITGGPDLTLNDANVIADDITSKLDDSANIILGARIKEDYKGKVRVMSVMTGVQSTNIVGNSNSSGAEGSFTANSNRETDVDVID